MEKIFNFNPPIEYPKFNIPILIEFKVKKTGKIILTQGRFNKVSTWFIWCDYKDNLLNSTDSKRPTNEILGWAYLK